MHLWQMQARLRSASGTRASSSLGISNDAHQHGHLWAASVHSWQSFGPPQSGQMAGSNVCGGFMANFGGAG